MVVKDMGSMPACLGENADLPLTSCAILGESLNLSVPYFLSPQNSNFHNAHIPGRWKH